MHCWALHILSTAQPSQQHHSPGALDTQPMCNGKLCQYLSVAKFIRNLPYSQVHQETALCLDCSKNDMLVCAFNYQMLFMHHVHVVLHVLTAMHFCNQHIHLLLACPASAVWWAMLYLLVHRPGFLGLCKAPLSHFLFYRRLLQRLV